MSFQAGLPVRWSGAGDTRGVAGNGGAPEEGVGGTGVAYPAAVPGCPQQVQGDVISLASGRVRHGFGHHWLVPWSAIREAPVRDHLAPLAKLIVSVFYLYMRVEHVS